MAAIVGNCINKYCGCGNCNLLSLSVPTACCHEEGVDQRGCSVGCIAYLQAFKYICTNSFGIFVTVAVVSNLPPLIMALTELPWVSGAKGLCHASLWLVLNGIFSLVNILAACYIAFAINIHNRIAAVRKEAGGGMIETIPAQHLYQRASYIFCYDPAVAFYIGWLLLYVIFLCVPHWLDIDEPGGENEEYSCSVFTYEKVLVAVGFGLAFLVFGFAALMISFGFAYEDSRKDERKERGEGGHDYVAMEDGIKSDGDETTGKFLDHYSPPMIANGLSLDNKKSGDKAPTDNAIPASQVGSYTTYVNTDGEETDRGIFTDTSYTSHGTGSTGHSASRNFRDQDETEYETEYSLRCVEETDYETEYSAHDVLPRKPKKSKKSARTSLLEGFGSPEKAMPSNNAEHCEQEGMEDTETEGRMSYTGTDEEEPVDDGQVPEHEIVDAATDPDGDVELTDLGKGGNEHNSYATEEEGDKIVDAAYDRDGSLTDFGEVLTGRDSYETDENGAPRDVAEDNPDVVDVSGHNANDTEDDGARETPGVEAEDNQGIVDLSQRNEYDTEEDGARETRFQEASDVELNSFQFETDDDGVQETPFEVTDNGRTSTEQIAYEESDVGEYTTEQNSYPYETEEDDTRDTPCNKTEDERSSSEPFGYDESDAGGEDYSTTRETPTYYRRYQTMNEIRRSRTGQTTEDEGRDSASTAAYNYTETSESRGSTPQNPIIVESRDDNDQDSEFEDVDDSEDARSDGGSPTHNFTSRFFHGREKAVAAQPGIVLNVQDRKSTNSSRSPWAALASSRSSSEASTTEPDERVSFLKPGSSFTPVSSKKKSKSKLKQKSTTSSAARTKR